MKLSFKSLACTVGILTMGQGVMAEPTQVQLDPIRHARAALVVAGPDGETTYKPAELEALGSMRMVTVTPWRDDTTEFDGVLLTDVLDANGLGDVDAIRVIAENDYAVTITAETWKRWPILVATRVNGKPHTRRERGPIQFVLPMSDFPEAGAKGHGKNWVWMAARIEVAE